MLNNEDYLNIFHEIKNSITLVNSSLQLVAKKHPEVCDFDYWNETMSEIDFLKNMVTQLSSARLCEHLNVMQVNMYSFMYQITRAIRALSWNGFTCNVILEEDLPLIELDPQLLKQAIVNIVKNAYEAMDCTGTATLHVFYQDDLMQITVTDHGGGLDPALADNIFQPFITSKTGGSGLGLVITKQIIESHHGTLNCISRPGDGCVFTIALPLTQN
ncbi:MAG: ATP-binding protein [Clostridiales bacterium]|nr:ATP-binding protein [Roseburia sp.]MDD7636104.1 ATP-binding protein [Clostridiales bacterium]MDY4112223.1 ATP-binding protein [Roseburia sp.]